MNTTPVSPRQPLFLSIRRRSAPATLGLVAARTGLAVGVLTSFGQSVLSGAPEALVNSASAWLVAPFVIGALVRTRSGAAAAGLVCCVLQLVGYDLCSDLRGFGVSESLDVFWAMCALVGGPLFGLAGHAWRFERPGLSGLGPATLSAMFATEGAWNYAHELHRPITGALWIAIAAVIALTGLRDARGWRWLALTVPVGLAGELVLTTIVR